MAQWIEHWVWVRKAAEANHTHLPADTAPPSHQGEPKCKRVMLYQTDVRKKKLFFITSSQIMTL